jgi:cell division septal protein FtsQ
MTLCKKKKQEEEEEEEEEEEARRSKRRRRRKRKRRSYVCLSLCMFEIGLGMSTTSVSLLFLPAFYCQ